MSCRLAVLGSGQLVQSPARRGADIHSRHEGGTREKIQRQIEGHSAGRIGLQRVQRHSLDVLAQTVVRKVVTLPLHFRAWPLSRVALQAGDQLVGNRYSQAAETEADRLGQQHLVEMGIDPNKAVEAMERLRSLQPDPKMPARWQKILSDHPPTQQRIEALRRPTQD
jgi:Zn-dependent protease with chaperone function